MFFNTTSSQAKHVYSGRFLELQGIPTIEKIQFCILYIVGVGLTLSFGFFWFNPAHVPSNFVGRPHIFDYLIFLTLSYIVWHHILMELFSWYITSYIQSPSHQEMDFRRRIP